MNCIALALLAPGGLLASGSLAIRSLAIGGILAGLLLVGACSNGSSGSDPAPTPLPPALNGAIYLGGGATKATRDFTVRAVDQGGNEWTRTESTSSRSFSLHHYDWDSFVGRVEATVEVATPTGPQTVLLARDLDLAAAAPADKGLGSGEPSVLPYCWLGPVSTVASRYRANHPEVSIAAAERLAAEHLGIAPPASAATEGAAYRDLHTSFGHSYRSPFAWSKFLADAGATPVDAAVDAVVAELGGSTPPRNHRRPHPSPAIHSLLRGGQNPEPYPWSAGGRAWVLDGIGEDAHFLATSTVAGTVLAKAGLGSDPDADYLAALDQLDQEVRALQASAIASSYEIAWRNTVELLNPACNRILTVHDQYKAFLQPGSYAPQQAAMALRTYAAQSVGGMAEDFDTLRDTLVGRATPNGPLASIYAAHLMLDRFGTQDPIQSLLNLDLRSNDLLDELQQAQDYYLTCLVLSMILRMEHSNLDPYTFPMTAGTGNSMAARISAVLAVAYGDGLSIPSTPGWFADMVAAQQLAPSPTIGHDDVLIDCNADDTVSATTWYLDATKLLCYVPSISAQTDIADVVASFCLGPWSAGSFRAPTFHELSRLRGRALVAGGGDVRIGLQRMGFTIPPTKTTVNWRWTVAYTEFFDSSGQPQYDGYYYDLSSGDTHLYDTGHTTTALLVRPAPGPDEDPGTAVACGVPVGILGQGPDSFEIDYKAWDQQGLEVNQSVMTVLPGTGTTAGFLTRSRIVWQFDPPTAPYRVVNGLDDAATSAPTLPIPFVQNLFPLTSPPPDPSTVALVGQVYSGYLGPAASVGNRRAAPVTVCIPLTSLQQQSGMPPPTETPTLSSVWAVPSRIVFTNATTTPYVDCYATTYFEDSSGVVPQVFDHSKGDPGYGPGVTVAWTVTSQSGLAHFSTSLNSPNRLILDPAQGQDTMQITVTVTCNGVTVTDTATCYTSF